MGGRQEGKRAPWNTTLIPRRGREGSVGSRKRSKRVKQAIEGCSESQTQSNPTVREKGV